MFCKNCGREIPENVKFCSGCGTPVSPPPQQPEQPPEPPFAPVQPPVREPETPADVPQENAPAESAPQDDLTAALEAAPETAETAVVVAPPPEIQPVPLDGAVPPVPPAPKKKKTGIILLAAAAAAVAIVLIALLVKLLPSGGSGAFAYLTEDGELMFRADLKAKTKAVELSDDEPGNVYFTADGKYIYFMEGDGGDTASLYRMETAKAGKKDASPEKVSSDVSRYSVSLLPSGGAVYIRGSGSDGQLRCFDGKESYKLASGISDFIVDEKGTYAYYVDYTETDSLDGYSASLYRIQIKEGGEKERLLKDVSAIYTRYDANVLVYGKSNGDGDWDRGYSGTYDIYSQVPGGEKTKLLSDVSDVLDISVDGGKVSLVYLTTETEEHTLYDFVSDSLASSDAGQREPSYDDYQTTNAWGWWTTDWEAYNAAYEVWSAVESRNYLRQSLKDTPYTVTTYTLNRYENGEKSTLAAELAFYPTFSAGAGVYLYARSEQEISAVCDVQDLAYSSDIYGMMDAAERSWYQNVGGEESPFDLDEDSSLDDLYVLNGNEAVLVVYEDGEALLQTYSVDKKGLTFVSTITDDDFSFPVMGRSGGKDALYYFTDMDKDRSTGELICYANGKETSVAKDADRVVLLDDGTVFKLEDISYNDRRSQTEGSLYVVKNGKSERIADDVFIWRTAYLSGSQVAYISDGDLFVWNGKDSEKLASDVTNFWSSSQAGYQSFSCN